LTDTWRKEEIEIVRGRGMEGESDAQIRELTHQFLVV
jgi:hypothetical protein